jgi:hypothetical protein
VNIKPPKGRPYYVYGYFDVREGKEGEPLYVGYSKFKEGKKLRALEHLEKGIRNKLFSNVLEKIKGEGREPEIRILMWFKEELRARKYEQSLIKRYGRRVLSKGSLCNLTDGGDGPGQRGYKHTEEFKEWNSERAKKQFKDPEQIKIQSEAAKRRWKDPTYRERYIEAIRERTKDEAYKENLRQKAKMQWTEEARKAKSEAQRTPEFIQMKKEYWKEYWSEERREEHAERMKKVRAASPNYPVAKVKSPRKKFGEWIGNAKVDEWQVRFIRYWASKDFKQIEIAKNFGITQAQVSNIVLGNSWNKVV